MPRFFFDIDEGGVASRDDEGVDLPDLQDAISEVMVTLPAIAREVPGSTSSLMIRSSVRNEIGQVIFEATLQVHVRQFQPS